MRIAQLQGLGKKVRAADGNEFVDAAAFAWIGGGVSLTANPAAALENGDCNIPGSLSRRNDIESDHRPGDSFVAFSCRQCRVQRLHRRAFDLDSHAVDHAGSSRLASLT